MATAPRALLFDRLRCAPPGAGIRGRSFVRDTITLVQHEASVFEQLDWLLNTRATWSADALDTRTRDGVRSTIDYGLPDLSLYPLGNSQAMTRLSRHLEEVIACYEPRIVAPRVALERSARRDVMRVAVSGTLRFEGREHPLQLRLTLQVEQGSSDAG